MIKTATSFSARMHLLCLVTVCFSIFMAGCATVKHLCGFQKPEARITRLSITDIRFDSMTLLLDVEANNPLPVSIILTNAQYTVTSGAIPFVKGKTQLDAKIPGAGKSTISFPIVIVFKQLLDALKIVSPNLIFGSSFPLKAELVLDIDSKFGAIEVPIHKEGQVRIPAIQEILISPIHNSTRDSNGNNAREK